MIVTCTVARRASSYGKVRQDVSGYRALSGKRSYVAARKVRYLTKQWDSIPENELRMSHLAKFGGTPEMVRLRIPLA